MASQRTGEAASARLTEAAATNNWSPLLFALREKTPTLWINKDLRRLDELPSLPLSSSDLDDARRTWEWLKPLLAHLFPDARQPPWGDAGTISSALRRTDALATALGLPAGQLFLKEDSKLAVCGSVKARGGMFEVFHHAGRVARAASGDESLPSISLATDPAITTVLAQHEVAVGSTGNLGLSVGLAASAIGMKATVHMSTDAKAWKKDLLRARGASVIEHAGPYGEAVAAGRAASDADPSSYFIDDEEVLTPLQPWPPVGGVSSPGHNRCPLQRWMQVASPIHTLA